MVTLPVDPDRARQLIADYGPVVTYCRIFAVGPACAVPCDGCRIASRDLHRAAARAEPPPSPRASGGVEAEVVERPDPEAEPTIGN